MTPRIQSQMRDKSGRLPVYKRVFEYHPAPKADNPTFSCTIKLQPASIETESGYVDFYPSADEEIVEEVIKKIFSDHAYGIHDAAKGESWVRFTLHAIRKELASRGKTRSIPEIKRSLEILSKTVLDVSIEGNNRRKTVYTNPILNDLTRVTRSDYLDDPNAMWAARLPGLVSVSVNNLSYRQFNYGVLMSLSSQLARWLHKRMSHEYTNASLMHPYKMLFSTIQRDSGLLHHARPSSNIDTVQRALDELAESKVLLSYTADKRHNGRAIADVLYTLTPHPDFVTGIKAANARASDARGKLAAPAPLLERADTPR
ncbi:hypothetical protein [Hyphomicrobium sp. MC8b]|uniref:hypothetical protein n=1 Tax=Hyphomicrobium sp. MC8b TaxID=300273 RepID=UPI00391B5EC7